jgi:hypothetical protein
MCELQSAKQVNNLAKEKGVVVLKETEVQL